MDVERLDALGIDRNGHCRLDGERSGCRHDGAEQRRNE